MKKIVLTAVITAILTGTLTVDAVKLMASEIEFKPNNSEWQVDNVNDAMNDLYNTSANKKFEVLSSDFSPAGNSYKTALNLTVSVPQKYSNKEVILTIAIAKEHTNTPTVSSITGDCMEGTAENIFNKNTYSNGGYGRCNLYHYKVKIGEISSDSSIKIAITSSGGAQMAAIATLSSI